MPSARVPQTNEMLAALAARGDDGFPPAAALALEVAGVEQLTPLMRRITVTADELDAFEYLPGQDLMLAVPTTDDATINRRYTIRAHDPTARTLVLDLIAHDHGPGGRWAASAAPGDRIHAIGPRGKVVLADNADWHLFVCDESGLPAAASMLEALSSTATAVAFIDVAGPEEEQPIATSADVQVSWLHRNGGAPGEADRIARAVSAAWLPTSTGHTYLAAEMDVVNAVRDLLLGRGFDPEQVSPKAYWRRGAANARHGEPLRDRG